MNISSMIKNPVLDSNLVLQYVPSEFGDIGSQLLKLQLAAFSYPLMLPDKFYLEIYPSLQVKMKFEILIDK